jgi:hypothetical protein
MTTPQLSPIEVQEIIRRLLHAEDMASRAVEGPARDELRREIRAGWLAIKPYATGRKVHEVTV